MACEIRFPDGSLDQSLPLPAQRAFRDLLGSDWVIETQRFARLNVEIGPAGTPSDMKNVIVPRFTVRDRTVAVAISPESITVETTRFTSYETYRPVIASALNAASKVLAPDGIARVGLRFIDEIRVPGVTQDRPGEWAEWLDPSLLGPGAPDHPSQLKLSGLQSIAQFETGPDRMLVLRYGVGFGHAVKVDGPLKRPGAPDPGPFFALDFDSSWSPQDIPEFDPTQVLALCDELEIPVMQLFDSLITEALLSEFRKEVNHND